VAAKSIAPAELGEVESPRGAVGKGRLSGCTKAATRPPRAAAREPLAARAGHDAIPAPVKEEDQRDHGSRSSTPPRRPWSVPGCRSRCDREIGPGSERRADPSAFAREDRERLCRQVSAFPAGGRIRVDERSRVVMASRYADRCDGCDGGSCPASKLWALVGGTGTWRSWWPAWRMTPTGGPAQSGRKKISVGDRRLRRSQREEATLPGPSGVAWFVA
jgi:hypothetical protein